MDNIDSKQGRLKALRTKPLRYTPGAPSVGKNGAKPFKRPDSNIKTVPLKFIGHKPLRGLTK